MPEWTVLIADDEPAARRGVRQLLTSFPEFTVIGECRNGVETLEALERSHPDVVFLDIQMPGVDGFEVIQRRTPERMPAVVFLTAYGHYAIQAFEAEALDYLVKPVAEERFAVTMSRIMRRLQETPREETLLVTTPSGLLKVGVREVEWIEAADNYARLWTTAGRSYLIRESLRDLERLHAHGFVRAHRRALVRVDCVRALTSSRSGGVFAVLASGTRVPISRRLRAAFRASIRSR